MRSAAGTAAEQLNDGPLADADFLKHARAQRKLPGEGELDVVGLIRAVQATGFRAVPRRGEHPGIRALPVGEAARRTGRWCDRRQAPRQVQRRLVDRPSSERLTTSPTRADRQPTSSSQPDEVGPTADLQR